MSFVDQSQVGLIGLDSSGVIVGSNEFGRQILSGEGGLRDENGRLRAQRAADSQALESLLELVLSSDTDAPRSGRLVVSRGPDPRRLTLWVSQVDGGRTAVAAVVAVVDPWRSIQLIPELVAESLGLTPAESRVAVALAEGVAARQFAEATGRSLSTVRAHVQQVLQKTHCSRQADLVRLVLASSHLPVAQGEPG